MRCEELDIRGIRSNSSVQGNEMDEFSRAEHKLYVQSKDLRSTEIRVRGRVQGVGFRPSVWRIARMLDLCGEVLNDAEGVLVRLRGPAQTISIFLTRLEQEQPPLARIDSIECKEFDGDLPNRFYIVPSLTGPSHTQITPDAAICPACALEIADPRERRFKYPFSNCTHCGPRLTIVNRIPYDRANTTMAPFVMCEACEAEYLDPEDRRFHAEAIACSACGPRLALLRMEDGAPKQEKLSPHQCIEAARRLIAMGAIVALKGLGGYHLACDATNSDVVARLRRLKHRDSKPFALMARDLGVIREYCEVDIEEERQLCSSAAPIVLLPANGRKKLPSEIAPGVHTLGFMLPTTPLHLLLLRRVDHPLVMTSGNLSDEPQATEDQDAMIRLRDIASHALIHDRQIANRLDNSVVRLMGGRPRVLRRARGYAPAPLRLPLGFKAAPQILAMGGELKATFCLLKDGEATLSQHQGDLEDVSTFDQYRKNLALYAGLFDHCPAALVVDSHPEYVSSKFGHTQGLTNSLRVLRVQHHHAHVATCLAENNYALDAPPVLGIVLDGAGYGDDGTIWGGEFLFADFRRYERLGALKPVAMPGGVQAVREPWRNLYAHLSGAFDRVEFERKFAQLSVFGGLAERRRATLDAMIRNGVNSPKASSCGRLFDAVAAALDICPERQSYEGEAAVRLEAIVSTDTLKNEGDNRSYIFEVARLSTEQPYYLEPMTMWSALLADLNSKTPIPVIAARFHKGLAMGIGAMAQLLASKDSGGARLFDTVALSGGCFQNHILFEEVVHRLRKLDFTVLTQVEIPMNDGGLSLGQATIGAAWLIQEGRRLTL